MKNYLNLMKDIRDNGIHSEYGNGIRHSLFNRTLEWDMADGFPLVTSKKMKWQSPLGEMLWFISGNKNTKDLVNTIGHNIWSMWELKEDHPGYDKGSIGPMYGSLWRNWNGINGKIDQLRNLVNLIRKHKSDTRMSMTAFDPELIATRTLSPQENILQGKGCLNPCHHFVQCHIIKIDNVPHLSLTWSMTSSDVPIGLPYNIAGYALLLHLLARETGCKPHMLYYHGGDAHIYENQLPLVDTQLLLADDILPLPTLAISGSNSMFDITLESLDMVDYVHHSFIRYPLS